MAVTARRATIAALSVAIGLTSDGWIGFRLWPRSLNYIPDFPTPKWHWRDGRGVITERNRLLVARIATYEDEFFAYLMFGYIRGAPMFRDVEVFLSYSRQGNRLFYTIQVRSTDDLLTAVSLLAQAKVKGLIQTAEHRYVTPGALAKLRYHTRLFSLAYNLPERRRLEELPRNELAVLIRRFLRFKSETDPRIRGRLGELPPQSLSSDEARQLAEDILAVADFYSLPLDFFLGIGAMENNYMNVPGDLENAAWKRRPEKGDVVLKRGRRRVLVANASSGIWQITRETLRYAHRLYLADTRDYGRLPERLVPLRELDVTNVAPEVLTTYAGILLRDLLDRCGGDAMRAVGAYNGGFSNPNARYAEGVARIAAYARRVLERAAVLNGTAAGRQFIMPAP